MGGDSAVPAEGRAGDDATHTEKSSGDTAQLSAKDRMDAFRALKLRAKDSRRQNRGALYREHARMKEDPKAARTLALKRAAASVELAKLDALASGTDYDRKRAWDWTVDESLRWDEKLARAEENRTTAGFADYAQEAANQYVRNTAAFQPDLEAYAREKARLAEESPTAATTTSVTVAADGSVLSSSGTNDTTTHVRGGADDVRFIHQRPSRANIDRLVADLSKTDAARLKAQVKRARQNGDEGDYISDRNRVFNQKVSRFYDKYTKEMKDSFERGTAN